MMVMEQQMQQHIEAGVRQAAPQPFTDQEKEKFFETAREGYLDAEAGEPLFPDADHAYAAGWCIFHGLGEFPFPLSSDNGSETDDNS